MSNYKIEVSKIIPTLPIATYKILADYNNGHPRILPKPYFTYLEVEQGGYGEGTIIRFQMNVFGKKQVFRAIISEPEPGTILKETILPSGPITTFKVISKNEGKFSQVTISTEINSQASVAGALERVFVSWILRHIYKQELKNLANFIQI